MKRVVGFISAFVLYANVFAQVGAPDLRCISCNAAGELTLTWIPPSDPGGQFFSYEIYKANSAFGPFNLVTTIPSYFTTSYTDIGGAGSTQSRYYFMKTVWGSAGTNTSTPSDTINSIFLNITIPSIGKPKLNYNNIHFPKLSSSAGNFDLYREFPTAVWTNFTSTSATNYIDTISRCEVLYNYQIQLQDNSGCVSTSNIAGGIFKDDTYPRTPYTDSVSVDEFGQTHIGWKPSPSPDCIAYVIYMKNAIGVWIPVDTIYGINNTNYTYTNTAAYSDTLNFRIAAIDSCNNISPMGLPHNTIFLKTKYDTCGLKTNLSWNSYENMPLGVLKYNVYCSVNAGQYSFIGTTAGYTFTHENVQTGKTYCYVVRAFNANQQITSSSNPACLITAEAPVPEFAYLKSVSVNKSQKVDILLFSDTKTSCKGFNLFRSTDGITYNPISFITFTRTVSDYYYTDENVKANSENYYYKAQVVDSCGNPRYMSNIGKTILLKVKNSNDKVFDNNLDWNAYEQWPNGMSGYYIRRIVNDTFQVNAIDYVQPAINSYTDNVEDVVKESGKVGYVVEAIEAFGNPYGFVASSVSNIAFAYVEAKIFVPNAFAVKGLNREWLPIAQFVEKTDYQVTVFDRWGKKVFETNDDNEAWNGSGAESGVYVYLIRYKNARGEYIELKGTITKL